MVRGEVSVAVRAALVLAMVALSRERFTFEMPPAMGDAEKQRVVTQFLTAEQQEPADILERLEQVFGNRTVPLSDVRQWATAPNVSFARLIEQEYEVRLHQRVVIQFLVNEGDLAITPTEIHGRLTNVYKYPMHLCSVYRWVTRFRQGQVNVENMRRVTVKPKPRKDSPNTVSFRDV